VTLEDVTNPLECEVRSSKSRPRALSALAFIASAIWMGCLVYGIYVENTGYAVKCLISLFEWGYVSILMAVRPLSTPPYILMLFACTHLIFGMAMFAFDTIDRRGNTVFNMVGIAVPAVFLWVAGTLPLQEVRCASNIARPKDVIFLSLLRVCC